MKLLSILSFLLFCLCVAEAQTYDISQYRARYERRPFMEFNPSFNYSGSYGLDDFFDRHFGGANLRFDWLEASNLDQRIQNFRVSGQYQFFRQRYENPDRIDFSSRNLVLLADIERYNYRQDNKFWGFRGEVSLTSRKNSDDSFPISSNSITNVAVNPGVFAGKGRIEFAQDALLANWIADDLLESEVIATATPEQRELLAQRITYIIGNRTFDFRRRRIYELQQLEQLFREENIVVENDFLLFAVLNDNWAFANRATLPRGQRLQFGVDASNVYGNSSSPTVSDVFVLEGRPYVSFTTASIKNNNASRVWGAELAGYYREDLINTPVGLANGYGVAVSLSHEYIWLPISRTTLRWRSTVTGQLSEEARFYNFDTDKFDGQLLRLSTELNWDYFISYNWRLVLTAGMVGSWGSNEFFTTRIINPYINFSTRYAIF